MSRLHIKKEIEEVEEVEELAEVVDIPFAKAIFDSECLGEVVPLGFDAVRILIDGRIKADLSWREAHAAAVAYVKKGLRLFWEIDLGLFDQLNLPISNQSQFLSLSLSLEHFRDTLWKEFRSESVGLCLYRGILKVPFDGEALDKESTQRDNQLFSARAAAEYLNLLANRLPDTLKCFALVDLSGVLEPFLVAQMLNKELYSRLSLAVKNGYGLGGELIWEGSCLSPMPTQEAIKIAVYLPSSSQNINAFNEMLIELQSKQILFRVIPESMLLMQWERLDYLIVQSKGINSHGRRQLCGFCAAGGIIVFLDEPINLSGEISFAEFINQKR